MSLCTNERFTINKGLMNEFILTIKKNESLEAIVIDPSDTFKWTLFELGSDKIVGVVDMSDGDSGEISVHNAAGGQILISLKDGFVAALKKEIGGKADRYPVKPMYRFAIECSTVANGKFIAKMPLVYVE